MSTYKRTVCAACGYPSETCVCRWLSPIRSLTQVHVMQHPAEQKVSKGTARLLQLALPEVKIYSGESADCFAELSAWLRQQCRQGATVALLYPTADALPADRYRQTLAGSHLDHLIVLDGTWRKVYKIYQCNPWLSDYPALKLPSNFVSQYTIRKASQANSRSTLEAVAELLSIVCGLDTTPLQQLFQGMIEQQMRRMPVTVKARYRSN